MFYFIEFGFMCLLTTGEQLRQLNMESEKSTTGLNKNQTREMNYFKNYGTTKYGETKNE